MNKIIEQQSSNLNKYGIKITRNKMVYLYENDILIEVSTINHLVNLCKKNRLEVLK